MASSSSPQPPLDHPRIKILTAGSPEVGKSCLIKRYCEGRFVAKYIPTIGIDYGVKKFAINAVTLQQHRQKLRGDGGSSAAQPSAAAVRVNFWDVAGGAESLEVRNEFYAPAQGILLVYDVRDRGSFLALDAWLEEINCYLSEDAGNPVIAGVAATSPRHRTSTMATFNTPAGKAIGGAVQGKGPVFVVCGNKVDDVITTTGDNPGSAKRKVTEAEGRAWAAKHHMTYYETSASSDLNVKPMLEGLFYDVVATFF